MPTQRERLLITVKTYPTSDDPAYREMFEAACWLPTAEEAAREKAGEPKEARHAKRKK